MNISDKDKEEYKQLVHYHLNVTMEFKQVDPNYIRGSKYLWSLKVQDEAAKILEKYKAQLALIDKNIKVGKGRSSPESKNRDAKFREFTRFFTKVLLDLNPPLGHAETEQETTQIVSNSKSEIELEVDEHYEPSLIPNFFEQKIHEPIHDIKPTGIWPDEPKPLIEESAHYEPLNTEPIPIPKHDHIQSVAVPKYHDFMRLLGLPLTITDCPHEHLENLCDWLIDNYNRIPAYDSYYSPTSDRLGIICKEFLDYYFDLNSHYEKCGQYISLYDFCKYIDGDLSITRILHDCRLLVTNPVLLQQETPIKRPVGRPPGKYSKESTNIDSTFLDLEFKVKFAKEGYNMFKELIISANLDLENYKRGTK